MAIQVSGTEVISNSRALNNIASVDATTAASITAAGVGAGGIDGIFIGWTALKTRSASNRSVEGVAVNGNTVITASTAGYIQRSTDGGVSWVETRLNINSSNSWDFFGILYNPDLSQWLLWNNGGDILYSTNNGASWASAQNKNTATDGIHQIVWSGSQYVAAVRGGSQTSSNGTSWSSKHTFGAYDSYNNSIAYGNSTYVMSYADYGGGQYKVLSSTNGSSWTERVSGTNADVSGGIVYFNGAFRYVRSDKLLFTSTNGTSFTATSTFLFAGFNARVMIDNGSGGILVNPSGSQVGYSSDGVNFAVASFTLATCYAYSSTTRYIGAGNGIIWLTNV